MRVLQKQFHTSGGLSMSDIDIVLPSAPLTRESPPESGGSLLRKARENSGISLSTLATLLKVSTSKLEALESNRWDLLPDIVFARALASSVCRALQIEVAPVLEHFPSMTTPSMKTDESGINAPFRTPGDGLGLAWVSHLKKPGTLAVLLLIFAAVALFLLPGDFIETKFLSSLSRGADTTATSIDSGITDADSNRENQQSSISVVTAQLPSIGQVTPSEFTSSPLPGEASVSPLPLTVESSGTVMGTVVLKATDASWVEVVDSRGVVQVRKIMAQGEVLGVSGEIPLSVVIGRADVVSVDVRGKNFDLVNLTKNNIARFEVK